MEERPSDFVHIRGRYFLPRKNNTPSERLTTPQTTQVGRSFYQVNFKTETGNI
jgi:hypothetical protein